MSDPETDSDNRIARLEQDHQMHTMEQERDHRTTQDQLRDHASGGGSDLFSLAVSIGKAHLDATRKVMRDTDPIPLMGLHGYSFASLKEVVEHLALEDFTDAELNQMNVLALRMQGTVRSRHAQRRADEKAKRMTTEIVKLGELTQETVYPKDSMGRSRYAGD